MGGGNKYREFTHLKFKKKFFNYKINVLLKNKSNSLNLKLFNYHLVRNNYVKVWKKQIQTYYAKKNLKLRFHRKFKYNYQLLFKNIDSTRFFNRVSFHNFDILWKVSIINKILQKLIFTKRRVVLKIFLYKNIVIFNFFFFFTKNLFQITDFFYKKINIIGVA